MGTTADDLRRWFKAGKEEGASHMIVVCDTFDWEDYPVYVKSGQDAREVAEEYNGKNMQRLMEVYNLQVDMEIQLKPGKRVVNW